MSHHKTTSSSLLFWNFSSLSWRERVTRKYPIEFKVAKSFIDERFCGAYCCTANICVALHALILKSIQNWKLLLIILKTIFCLSKIFTGGYPFLCEMCLFHIHKINTEIQIFFSSSFEGFGFGFCKPECVKRTQRSWLKFKKNVVKSVKFSSSEIFSLNIFKISRLIIIVQCTLYFNAMIA